MNQPSKSVATLSKWTIEIDSGELSPEEAASVTEIFVRQRLSAPSQFEITLSEPPASLQSKLGPCSGAPVRITAGEDGLSLIDGKITAVEYAYGPEQGRVLRVRGYDALYPLLKNQQIRSHIQVTCKEILESLAGTIHLQLDAHDDGPVWPWCIQNDKSDLDFARRVTQRCGLYFILNGATLHLISLAGFGEVKEVELGHSLLEAHIEVNGGPSQREIETLGWDPNGAEQRSGCANGPRSGAEVKCDVHPGMSGGPGKFVISNRIIRTDKEAEAISQAALDSHAASEVVLRGIVEGDPELLPGRPISVMGVAPELEGRYVVTEVDHSVNTATGYICRISTTPPEAAPQPKGGTFVLGTVISVEDPENRGRVKLSLPSLNDVETDWLSVLIAGAGDKKGLVVLPGVDDRVLALLPGDDPSSGIVLGGLYEAGSEPPDWGVRDHAVKRYAFYTPGGQKFFLDDEKKTVRLENSKGSFWEITPDKVTLHADGADLEIGAPGHQVLIKGKNIDFKNE